MSPKNPHDHQKAKTVAMGYYTVDGRENRQCEELHEDGLQGLISLVLQQLHRLVLCIEDLDTVSKLSMSNYIKYARFLLEIQIYTSCFLKQVQ